MTPELISGASTARSESIARFFYVTFSYSGTAGTEDNSGTRTYRLPSDYDYCTHQIEIQSQRPRDDRLITVTQVIDGIDIYHLIPHMAYFNGVANLPITTDGDHWLKYQVRIVGILKGSTRPTSPSSAKSDTSNWVNQAWASYCHFPAEDMAKGRQKDSGGAGGVVSGPTCTSSDGSRAYSAVGTGPNRSIACVDASNNAQQAPIGLRYVCQLPCDCSEGTGNARCTVEVHYSNN